MKQIHQLREFLLGNEKSTDYRINDYTQEHVALCDRHVPFRAKDQGTIPHHLIGGDNGGASGAIMIQRDDTSGFALALLPAAQVAALLAIPHSESLKLLDAAGVPHSAADTDADLRTK